MTFALRISFYGLYNIRNSRLTHGRVIDLPNMNSIVKLKQTIVHNSKQTIIHNVKYTCSVSYPAKKTYRGVYE